MVPPLSRPRARPSVPRPSGPRVGSGASPLRRPDQRSPEGNIKKCYHYVKSLALNAVHAEHKTNILFLFYNFFFWWWCRAISPHLEPERERDVLLSGHCLWSFTEGESMPMETSCHDRKSSCTSSKDLMQQLTFGGFTSALHKTIELS